MVFMRACFAVNCGELLFLFQGLDRPRMGRTVFRRQIEPIGLHSLHHRGGSGRPVDLPVHRLHSGVNKFDPCAREW